MAKRAFLIEILTRVVCWFAKNKEIPIKSKPVKVNIGSGMIIMPGWINIDSGLFILIAKMPRAILVVKNLVFTHGMRRGEKNDTYDFIRNSNYFMRNIQYGIPLGDETVDFIYSSHFLEHLFNDDAKIFLKETFRVLKKGGSIRLCVPDLEVVISQYCSGSKEKALAYLYSSSRSGYFAAHKYMYDYGMLKEELEKIGFSDIYRCGYGQGITPDIEELDNQPEDTLYIEAIK